MMHCNFSFPTAGTYAGNVVTIKRSTIKNKTRRLVTSFLANSCRVASLLTERLQQKQLLFLFFFTPYRILSCIELCVPFSKFNKVHKTSQQSFRIHHAGIEQRHTCRSSFSEYTVFQVALPKKFRLVLVHKPSGALDFIPASLSAQTDRQVGTSNCLNASSSYQH